MWVKWSNKVNPELPDLLEIANNGKEEIRKFRIYKQSKSVQSWCNRVDPEVPDLIWVNQHLTKVLSRFNIGDVNPEVLDLQKQSESGSSGSTEDGKQQKQVNPEVPDPLSQFQTTKTREFEWIRKFRIYQQLRWNKVKHSESRVKSNIPLNASRSVVRPSLSLRSIALTPGTLATFGDCCFLGEVFGVPPGDLRLAITKNGFTKLWESLEWIYETSDRGILAQKCWSPKKASHTSPN